MKKIVKAWEEKKRGKELALAAAAGIAPNRLYRQANKNDYFFKYDGKEIELITYDKFKELFSNTRLAQYSKNEYSLGGIITFSTNISHKWEGEKRVPLEGVIERIVAFVKTKFNTWFPDKKINEAVSSIEKPIGFSLGNFFRGRFIDKDKNVFDEKSVSLDIKGINSEELEKIGYELARQFDQTSVMIEDRNTNRAYELYLGA